MRDVARKIVIAFLAILGAVLMSPSVIRTTTVQLQATYALKGTQFWPFHITSDQAIQELAIRYVGAFTGSVPTDVDAVPNEFGVPALQQAVGGDTAPVIFGYSQGAFVGSEYKRAFNADPTPGTVPTSVLIGNPERPNGRFRPTRPRHYSRHIHPDRDRQRGGRSDHHLRHLWPVRSLLGLSD